MLDEFVAGGPPDPRPDPRPRASASTSALAAAMIAVGEIIEPEKAKAETVQVAPSGEGPDDGLDLDFGDLPDLT